MLTALNLDLRNEYVADCARGLRKWNQELEDAGLEQRLTLPHEGFNRKVGVVRRAPRQPGRRAARPRPTGSGRPATGCPPTTTGPRWPS